MATSPNPVQLAVIGGPHGIRGEVKVKSFTGDPLALGDYGPLQAADGRRFTVTTIRPAKNGVVVRFKEVADRSDAEGLSGTALFVDRAALPDDLDDDEFYHADLIGLAVRDPAGGDMGTVSAVLDFGAGDVVEVRSGKRGTVMVPFTLAAIPHISLKEGFIVVDPAAAGLVDASDDEGVPPQENDA